MFKSSEDISVNLSIERFFYFKKNRFLLVFQSRVLCKFALINCKIKNRNYNI